jgi:hypothetical protein
MRLTHERIILVDQMVLLVRLQSLVQSREYQAGLRAIIEDEMTSEWLVTNRVAQALNNH